MSWKSETGGLHVQMRSGTLWRNSLVYHSVDTAAPWLDTWVLVWGGMTISSSCIADGSWRLCVPRRSPQIRQGKGKVRRVEWSELLSVPVQQGEGREGPKPLAATLKPCTTVT